MKVYVHGNKWVLRSIGLVLTSTPTMLIADYFFGVARVLRALEVTGIALLAVASIVLGVGIFSSTIGKE